MTDGAQLETRPSSPVRRLVWIGAAALAVLAVLTFLAIGRRQPPAAADCDKKPPPVKFAVASCDEAAPGKKPATHRQPRTALTIMATDRSDAGKSMRSVGALSSVGLTLVMAIVIGTAAGYGIDRLEGLSPPGAFSSGSSSGSRRACARPSARWHRSPRTTADERAGPRSSGGSSGRPSWPASCWRSLAWRSPAVTWWMGAAVIGGGALAAISYASVKAGVEGAASGARRSPGGPSSTVYSRSAWYVTPCGLRLTRSASWRGASSPVVAAMVAAARAFRLVSRSGTPSGDGYSLTEAWPRRDSPRLESPAWRI